MSIAKASLNILIAGLLSTLATFARPASADPAGAGHGNAHSQEQCHLFSDGVQADPPYRHRVLDLQPTLQNCQGPLDGVQIATRTMKVKGQAYLLLVDPDTLKTHIERDSCWVCQPMDPKTFSETRFGSSVTRLARRLRGPENSNALINSGLRTSENRFKGAIVTADLCPSPKPLARDLIMSVEAEGPKSPIALSISGVWLKSHVDDFSWIKEQVKAGKLSVTWVNHSYHHPYREHQPNEENFLLRSGILLSTEILETERLLIEHGATPSVFFRFPGLVSDLEQMDELKSYSLIAVGADAWLSRGESSRDASIILVHANGNEPGGVARLKKLITQKRLPLPLRSLGEAPRQTPAFNERP